jgi:hypothetical protein
MMLLARKTAAQHQDNCRSFTRHTIAFRAKQQRPYCHGGEPIVFQDKTAKINQILRLLGHGRGKTIKENKPKK